MKLNEYKELYMYGNVVTAFKMKRNKQLLILSGLAVLCTLVFVSLRPPSVLSDEGKNRLDSIITKSAEFSSQVKSQTKSQSNVIIEDENNLLAVAKKVHSHNGVILVTMVNDAYLPFTYSWLCNTKTMNIHKSVLIITTDKVSKDNLTRDWPEISVVSMDLTNTKGDQTYSKVGYVKIMIQRTEMLLSILMADMEIFLFEVDCLWLANPTPEFQKIKGYDILVNPVSQTNNKVFAGGFLYLYTTDNAKALWKKVTEEMILLGERIATKSDTAAVSEAENDQQFLSRLLVSKYHNITMKILPLDVYADGKWYEMSKELRDKSHPIVINNNWVLGNQAKVKRAKEWKHWFIHEDWTCDMDLVKKVLY